MTELTDLDMWSAIAGFAMPPLVAVVVRGSWPSWARALTALAICAAGGYVTAWLTGHLAGVTPARAVLITTFSALGFYRLWWHPSKIAPAIEKATSPHRRVRHSGHGYARKKPAAEAPLERGMPGVVMGPNGLLRIADDDEWKVRGL